MLGRLDSGRQPTEIPVFFGGGFGSGLGHNFALHLHGGKPGITQTSPLMEEIPFCFSLSLREANFTLMS
jgi:hypothetical protein